MKLRVVGISAGSAINHVLELCEGKTDKQVVDLLIHNTATEMLPSNTLPKDFASGKMVDITAGELLGLGVAGAWYDCLGQEKGNTYQVVVAVDDTSKKDVEFLLSDGAIWHDQANARMIFQQVAVQGYYPKKHVGDDDIIEAIRLKTSVRQKYQDNCGLIVNIYSRTGQFDFTRIMRESDVDKFDTVLCIVYGLPVIKEAFVKYLSKTEMETLPVTIMLNRFPKGDGWLVNDDAKSR
jgi:hypothetical protein